MARTAGTRVVRSAAAANPGGPQAANPGGPQAASAERLIKSTERVRDLGEVFTPRRIVDDMLDLLPAEVWHSFPQATFLEPACGDGNFVVAIVERKLAQVAADWQAGTLPAGADVEALWFHGLAALASVYGVDISADNIIGGSPEHPIGARERVLTLFTDWVANTTGKRPAARSKLRSVASWIANANLIVGDMLPVDAAGKPRALTGIKLVEYAWEPTARQVTLSFTDMQQVMDEAAAETTEQMSLFGEAPAAPSYVGNFLELHRCPPPSNTDEQH